MVAKLVSEVDQRDLTRPPEPKAPDIYSERMRELAAFIRQIGAGKVERTRFYMRLWLDRIIWDEPARHPELADWSEPQENCGTACCMAGAAVLLFDKTTGRPGERGVVSSLSPAAMIRGGVKTTAQSLLGLNDAQATALFYRDGINAAEHAAGTLEWLADHRHASACEIVAAWRRQQRAFDHGC